MCNTDSSLMTTNFGKIIILNGVPRSGKSSIANAIQDTFDGIWMNIGVDNYMKMIPNKVLPGIGLRPGKERPDLEDIVHTMYHALYETIKIHSEHGFNVVVDVGHHDNYETLNNVFSSCLKIIEQSPVFIVGVNCTTDELAKRRSDTGYPCFNDDGSIITPVLRWQEYIHMNKTYDLMVDTTNCTANECALQIKCLVFYNTNLQ